MKIMLNHSSAKSGQRTANSEQVAAGTAKGAKNRTANLNGTDKTTISNALRRRAQAVIKDRSIDAQSRAIIRYALETNDPWLPDLVRRVDAGETIIETIVVLKRPKLTSKIGQRKRSKR